MPVFAPFIMDNVLLHLTINSFCGRRLMNNTRRTKIRKVVKELKSIKESYRLDIIGDGKFEEVLDKCSIDIEELLYEEEKAYDVFRNRCNAVKGRAK